MNGSPNKDSFLFLGEDGMNEKAISIIQKYVDKNLFKPRSNWSKYYFKERSYSRWAAYEIQERIIEEILRLPTHITGREQKISIEIIKEFINEMDYYNEINSNRNSSFIFSVAKDTAKEILYLFERR